MSTFLTLFSIKFFSGLFLLESLAAAYITIILHWARGRKMVLFIRAFYTDKTDMLFINPSK